MSRCEEFQFIFASAATNSPAVRLPEGILYGVALVHPALTNTTTTVEVARDTDTTFATAFQVQKTVTANTVITLSDPDALRTEDVTAYLRACGGMWLRLTSSAVTQTSAATCWWRVTTD